MYVCWKTIFLILRCNCRHDNSWAVLISDIILNYDYRADAALLASYYRGQVRKINCTTSNLLTFFLVLHSVFLKCSPASATAPTKYVLQCTMVSYSVLCCNVICVSVLPWFVLSANADDETGELNFHCSAVYLYLHILLTFQYIVLTSKYLYHIMYVSHFLNKEEILWNIYLTSAIHRPETKPCKEPTVVCNVIQTVTKSLNVLSLQKMKYFHNVKSVELHGGWRFNK